jgi:peptidoglycan hydrolase-like protein with peptidoglycan-binding domain
MKVVDMLLNKGLTGKPLGKVNGVVIHWFASPMAKAKNVIKYWEGQANGVNAHDVICLDGTIFHAVPYSMMAYQVGCPRGYSKEAVRKLSSYPNRNVVGIECAHKDMTGEMTEETYKALVEQSAYLLKKFNLSTDDLWLHSEIVGKDYKDCHRWFTTTKPSDWNKYKNDVAKLINENVVVEVDKVSQVDVNSDIINLGDYDSKVKTLQENLNKLGYNVGTVDSAFGKLTETEVKKFQKANGLIADGLVGEKTLAAIEKALKNMLTTTPSTSGSIKQSITPKPVSPTPVAPKKDVKVETIKSIQTKLNKLYNTKLNVDGLYGSATKKALIKGLQTELNKQANAKLKVDGVWGNATKSKCLTIDNGDKGNITYILQATLFCLGYDPNGLDSIFGNGTLSATKKFQKAKGLTQDGQAGKNTWEKIFK